MATNRGDSLVSAYLFFFFFLVVKQPVVLPSCWSSRGALETVPLLSLTCPLLPLALWGAPKVTTVLLEPPFIGFGLLDVAKPSAQELTDVDEEHEEEEEDERRRGYGVGVLRTIFGDIEETLGGGGGGGCCFSLRGGDNTGCLLATMSPWSLSTTSASRLSAWAFSSTLSVIISVAAIIF